MACYENESVGEYVMSSAKPFDGNKKAVCKRCYDIFIKNGYTDAAARGALANMFAESGFDYSIITWDSSTSCSHYGIGGGLIGFYFNGSLQDSYFDSHRSTINSINTMVVQYLNSNGYSLCANGKTKTAVQAFLKSKGQAFPFDLEFQMGYVLKVSKFLKNYSDSKSAAWDFMAKVERPAKKYMKDRWATNGNTINKMLDN